MKKVSRIKEIAKALLDGKVVTDLFFIEPDNFPLFDRLSKKYLRSLYKSTHGAGGTANMSYWAAMDLPVTKYVLHYDCDILLY